MRCPNWDSDDCPEEGACNHAVEHEYYEWCDPSLMCGCPGCKPTGNEVLVSGRARFLREVLYEMS